MPNWYAPTLRTGGTCDQSPQLVLLFTEIGKHWIVTVFEESKDVLGVGVLGGGDPNGNGGGKRH